MVLDIDHRTRGTGERVGAATTDRIEGGLGEMMEGEAQGGRARSKSRDLQIWRCGPSSLSRLTLNGTGEELQPDYRPEYCKLETGRYF